MKLTFDARGWEDYQSWVAGASSKPGRAILTRLNRLITEAMRDPGAGIGKPERLKGELSGYWSRRITDEHRLVYCVRDDQLIVIACRFHYTGI